MNAKYKYMAMGAAALFGGLYIWNKMRATEASS